MVIRQKGVGFVDVIKSIENNYRVSFVGGQNSDVRVGFECR